MMSPVTNLLAGASWNSYIYPDRYRPPYYMYPDHYRPLYSAGSIQYLPPQIISLYRPPRRHPRRYASRRNNRPWIFTTTAQQTIAEDHTADIHHIRHPVADEGSQDAQVREDVSMTLSLAREEESNNQEEYQTSNWSQSIANSHEGRSFSWRLPGDTLVWHSAEGIQGREEERGIDY